MPKVGFNDVNQLDDPAPSWRFYCDFPPIGGKSIKSVQLQKISLPHTGLEFSPTYIAGSALYYPKDYGVQQVLFTFYEDKTYSVLKYIYTWRSKVVDDTGRYGLPKNYKKKLQVQMMDIKGNVALTVNLIGSCPASPGEYLIDSESGANIITMAAFSVDKIQLEGVTTNNVNI